MNKPKKYNLLVRILFSLLLAALGALMFILWPASVYNPLISNIGLAFIVAGIISTFHEAVIKRIEGDEGSREVAERVHQKFSENPLASSGIRLASPVRKGYDGYYQWTLRRTPDEMFFAGRSVLHRVDKDLKSRLLGSAEELLLRRLTEKGCIRIMFLDPRSDLIPRLAKEEHQKVMRMWEDITTSIGVAVRLYNKLSHAQIPPEAHLEICLYDEVPYFAYHADGEQAIVGFYFASARGDSSAAYDLVDSQTQSLFEGHFVSMLTRARSAGGMLVELNPNRGAPFLDKSLLAELKTFLEEKLSKNHVDEVIP